MVNRFVKTRTHVICPNCEDDEYDVQYFLEKENSEHSHTCRSCNYDFTIEIKDGAVVNVLLNGTKTLTGYALFVIDQNYLENGYLFYDEKIVKLTEKDIFFIIDNVYIGKTIPINEELVITPEIFEQRKYFYTEHTCPVNFIPVHKILMKDDPDPHGVALLLKVWTKEEFEKMINVDSWVSGKDDEGYLALLDEYLTIGKET